MAGLKLFIELFILPGHLINLDAKCFERINRTLFRVNLGLSA